MSNITVTKNKDQQVHLINNELHIRSADRGRKDISSWRQALISAEAIHTPYRSRLYDLYDDILLDGHLAGIIAKRIDAVLNKNLYFEQDGHRIHDMDRLINSNAFRGLLRIIMQTPLWGISGIEFIPGREFNYKKIPRKHIRPAEGIIAYEQNSTEGIPYAGLTNVWIMGEPDDLGLLLKCTPYAIYKRGDIADWSQYIEIFGQPVRVMKYDAYDEQGKQQLKKALEESGSSLTLLLPKQAEFDMQDGKFTNGDGKLHQSFVTTLNAEMSILILGNTETTLSSYSSGYAQSKVHEAQQLEITKSDMAYTAGMLNTPKFLDILRAYGLPVGNGHFVFDRVIDLDDLGKRLAIDEKLATHVAISDQYWYETYGITKPVDG